MTIVWSPQSNQDVDAWLEHHRPSQAASYEGEEAILAHVTPSLPMPPEDEIALQARGTLENMTKQIRQIQLDDSIPVRSSKAKGVSKKKRREAIHNQFTASLFRLCAESQPWQLGYWTIYLGASQVDWVFENLVKSLIDGPLSQAQHAQVVAVKVLRNPLAEASSKYLRHRIRNRGRNRDQLISVLVYFHNVWDRYQAKEVLEILLQDHGFAPHHCKAEIYGRLGIDSKHESRVRSTLYICKELNRDEQPLNLENQSDPESGEDGQEALSTSPSPKHPGQDEPQNTADKQAVKMSESRHGEPEPRLETEATTSPAKEELDEESDQDEMVLHVPASPVLQQQDDRERVEHKDKPIVRNEMEHQAASSSLHDSLPPSEEDEKKRDEKYKILEGKNKAMVQREEGQDNVIDKEALPPLVIESDQKITSKQLTPSIRIEPENEEESPTQTILQKSSDDLDKVDVESEQLTAQQGLVSALFPTSETGSKRGVKRSHQMVVEEDAEEIQSPIPSKRERIS